MKRIVCLMLALLMCCGTLVSCGDNVKMDLVEEGACNIVYDADLISEDQVNKLAKNIEKATGVKPTVKSDSSFAAGIKTPERTILIGNIELNACKNALEGLRNKGYVVGIYDKYFVLGSKSASGTGDAIQYFKNTVLAEYAKEGKLVFNSKNNYKNEGNYDVRSLTIGGVSLADCEIVLSNKETISEKLLAINLKQLLYNKTGYTLEIVKKSAATKAGAIYIGSLCEGLDLSTAHSFAMNVKGTTWQIAAESLFGYEEMEQYIDEKLFDGDTDTFAFDDSFSASGNGAARASQPLTTDSDIRILFNNLWGGEGGGNKERMEMVVELYEQYHPDIIGLQECAPTLREAGVVTKLQALGYAEVPTDPSAKYYGSEGMTRTPLLYNTATLELLHAGYTCLAVMDYEKYPSLMGNYTKAEIEAVAKGDRSKAVTWGIFRHKETGKLFMAGSLHLWWQGGAVDDVARVLQMQEMRNLTVDAVRGFMEKNGLSGMMPIYLGGDYNSRVSRPSYATMSAATPFANLNDMVTDTAHKLTKDTTHGYPTWDATLGVWHKGTLNAKATYESAIDHIFGEASTQAMYKVDHMGMLTDSYAYTSDHSPIFADITFTDSCPTGANIPVYTG